MANVLIDAAPDRLTYHVTGVLSEEQKIELTTDLACRSSKPFGRGILSE